MHTIEGATRAITFSAGVSYQYSETAVRISLDIQYVDAQGVIYMVFLTIDTPREG